MMKHDQGQKRVKENPKRGHRKTIFKYRLLLKVLDGNPSTSSLSVLNRLKPYSLSHESPANPPWSYWTNRAVHSLMDKVSDVCEESEKLK